MKCLCCDTDIILPGNRKGMFMRPLKTEVSCPVCQSKYRYNQLPVLVGTLVMVGMMLMVGLIAQRFVIGMVLGALLMLSIVDPWLRRKPLVLVHPTRAVTRHPRAMPSVWSPLPVLLLALLVVWYFMFVH